ncbi:hypothetical protein BKA64DRAFT_642021 [Cadophora sp. MPI-SDFR-AT-0126]|nr:hypothetical protein BKA64DRAFT_642021 [Leotiomycetes sp. MPI-SDFR-AT-0126]
MGDKIQWRFKHSHELDQQNVRNAGDEDANNPDIVGESTPQPGDPETSRDSYPSGRGIVDNSTSLDTKHEHRSTKRARVETTRSAMLYPRKRAVRACQLCRARKTKCNNVRPVCGACNQIGAQCFFEDSLDHSSLIMLERLNQIIDTLNTHLVPGPSRGLQQQGSDNYQSFDQEHLQENRAGPNSTGVNHVPIAESNSRKADQNIPPQFAPNDQDDLLSSEYLHIPGCRTNLGTILQWPIFQAKFPAGCLDESFALFSEASTDHVPIEDAYGSPRKSNWGHPHHGVFGVHEEEIEGLVEEFLALVHIKNPILHPDSLRLYARNVAEYGPQWDSRSCLVYLASSLGCLAKSFQSKDFRPADSAEPNERTSTEQDYQNLRHAEAYYTLARKRIGLLLPSIMTAHCYFFCGVYLMYIVQPLQAWNNFYQASTLCHIEMRGELPLPISALGTLDYPHLFPNPPEVCTPAAEARLGQWDSPSESYSPAVSSSLSRRQESLASYSEDQSWYYYLTEIALRRIGNRVLNTFFKDESCLWWLNVSIPALIKAATKFESEISQMVEKLPDSLRHGQHDLGILVEGELAYVIRARVAEIRSWIYRPLMFYAVHRPADDPNQILIRGFVQDSLEYALRGIESVAHRHRHHGTWYALRNGTSAAFRIIAAVKCGHLDVPPGWQKVVLNHVSILKYWEGEALDLARARGILEKLLAEIGIYP